MAPTPQRARPAFGPRLGANATAAEVQRGAVLYQLRTCDDGHWEIWSRTGRQWVCEEWAGFGDLYEFADGTAFLEGMIGQPMPLPSEVIEALADELLKTKGSGSARASAKRDC